MNASMNESTWVRPRGGGKVHQIGGGHGRVQGPTNCGVRPERLVKVAKTEGVPNNACEKCFPGAKA